MAPPAHSCTARRTRRPPITAHVPASNQCRCQTQPNLGPPGVIVAGALMDRVATPDTAGMRSMAMITRSRHRNVREKTVKASRNVRPMAAKRPEKKRREAFSLIRP